MFCVSSSSNSYGYMHSSSERLWIDRNKHRLANKSEVCRVLWYHASFLCTQKHCTTVARSGKSCGACYTHGQLVNISAKPWNEQIKSSIFRRQKNLQGFEVQGEITRPDWQDIDAMPQVLSWRLRLNGVAPRAKNKLWRHAQLALKLIPAAKESHDDRTTWKLADGTNR